MAQLSIFDKQRHFSNKDMTISIGKGDYIYITFRHDSWKRFTDLNRITVSVDNNKLSFGTPGTDQGVSFKLKMTHGNPETFEHTRYIQISGKAWPAILEAARNMAGSYDFDKPVLTCDPTPEQVEELKNMMLNVEPLKLEPYEEHLPRHFVPKEAPKGYIYLHKNHTSSRLLLRASSVMSIEEAADDDEKVTFLGLEYNGHFFHYTVEEDFDTVMFLLGSELDGSEV